MLARFADGSNRQSQAEGQKRPRGTGRRRSSKEVVKYPLSGWRGTDARFPLNYTPRRDVGRPPPSRPDMRPPARKRYCVQSLPERYLRPLPPWDVCFSGSFFMRPANRACLPTGWITGRIRRFSKRSALWYADCATTVRDTLSTRIRASSLVDCLQGVRRDCEIFPAHLQSSSRRNLPGSSRRRPRADLSCHTSNR